MRGVPHQEDFFGRLARQGYRPRQGQRDFWNIVSSAQKHTYLGVLPTGYGKSETALGSYLIVRDQGRVNRMLIVVPTDTQRKQYADDLSESAQRLGGELLRFGDVRKGRTSVARDVNHEPSDLRLSNENRCEVFVTTVQSVLSQPAFYSDLMSKHRWLTFFDEYHKLNRDETARWGKAALGVKGDVVIGLTATPVRSDNSPTIFDGVPVDVTVSFAAAYKEKAIRGVRAHVEHYFVDMRNAEGDVERLTTEDLRNVQNWDDYQAKRDLRFTNEYLSGILSSAHDCLEAKNLRHFGQHQMLVFAMNLDHAEHVSNVLNAVYGAGFSDWVGIRRSDNENEAVLENYQENKLPCLVQVDKATEGFNNKRASVLVFLNILKKNTIKAIQGAGRGVRRNGAIREFTDDICDMFASPDTEMSELIQDFARLTVGIDVPDKNETSGTDGEGSEPRAASVPMFSIPPFDSTVVSAEYDRSEIIQITQSDIQAFRDLLAQDILESTGYKPPLEELAQVWDDDRLSRLLQKHKQQEAKDALSKVDSTVITRSKVQKAVQILAGNVVRKLYGKSADRNLIGELAKRIHQRWTQAGGRRAKDSLEDDLVKKYEWIRNLNEAVRGGLDIPEWLAI